MMENMHNFKLESSKNSVNKSIGDISFDDVSQNDVKPKRVIFSRPSGAGYCSELGLNDILSPQNNPFKKSSDVFQRSKKCPKCVKLIKLVKKLQEKNRDKRNKFKKYCSEILTQIQEVIKPRLDKYFNNQQKYENLLKSLLSNTQDIFTNLQRNHQVELAELIYSVTEKLVKDLGVLHSNLEQNERLKGQYKASKMYDYLHANEAKYQRILKEYNQLSHLNAGKSRGAAFWKCSPLWLGFKRAKTSRSPMSVPTPFEITSDIKKTLLNYDNQIKSISQKIKSKQNVLKEIGIKRTRLTSFLAKNNTGESEQRETPNTKPLHHRSLSMVLPHMKGPKFNCIRKNSIDENLNSSNTSNRSMLIGYHKGINSEIELKMTMKGLKTSIEHEIKSLIRRKKELEKRKEFEESQINDVSASFISYESKTVNMEKQKGSVLLQNSFLENELKERDSEVSELVKEINNKYKNRKKLSVSLNISNSGLNIEKNQSIDLKNEHVASGGITQDTRFQTNDSARETSEIMKNFFSTFSNKLEEALVSQKVNSTDEKKVNTQRVNKRDKFMMPESPSLYGIEADLFSEREINEEMLNIDDSLSDVPVKDCTNIEEGFDISNNLSIEESEMILDNLEFLSPMMKKSSKDVSNGSGKVNGATPSFKQNYLQRQNEFKLARNRVKSSINFDGHSNVPHFELGNIPEEIDESKNFSETTQNNFGNCSNSRENSVVKEEFNWNKSESRSKSNSGKKVSNSSDQEFGKLTTAFDKFMKVKCSEQVITGSGERLTFSKKDEGPTVNQVMTPEKKTREIQHLLGSGKLTKNQSICSSKQSRSICKRAPSISSQSRGESVEKQHTSSFGATPLSTTGEKEARSLIYQNNSTL
ncbi:unnamed protein product [Moneuplotes crassus]|uniref:Uncharacterized protein n=1 Tax=Euplotes crassus TaxID=5936 RepID=A0AAD1Y486_EUPCR|nr:unnamed protein product [Moneuplotes crassus]